MKYLNIKLWILTLFVLTITNVLSQKTEYGSTTESYIIQSDNNDEYKIKITLPNNYDSNKSYKVLYYLDSWWLSEIVLGSYAILNITEYVEEVVFVGISANGNQLDWNIRRVMDYTPTPYDTERWNKLQKSGFVIKSGGADRNPSTTGGANKFIDFLSNKVFTFVEDKHPNLQKRRGLIGHSLGGLFGIYVLQQNPILFTDVIVISSTVTWNESEQLDSNLFSKFTKSEKKHKLYVAVGGKEFEPTIAANKELNNILKNLENARMDYKFKIYDESNHQSILSNAIYDGLLFLYNK